MEHIKEMLKKFNDEFEDLDFDDKKTIVHGIIKNIFMTNDSLEIKFF